MNAIPVLISVQLNCASSTGACCEAAVGIHQRCEANSAVETTVMPARRSAKILPVGSRTSKAMTCDDYMQGRFCWTWLHGETPAARRASLLYGNPS